MYGRQGNNSNVFNAKINVKCWKGSRYRNMFIFLNHLPCHVFVYIMSLNFIRLCLWSFRNKHISGIYALQGSYTHGNGGNGPFPPPMVAWPAGENRSVEWEWNCNNSYRIAQNDLHKFVMKLLWTHYEHFHNVHSLRIRNENLYISLWVFSLWFGGFSLRIFNGFFMNS